MGSPATVLSGFRGIVADRDGESTPAEWELLSPEAPPPAAVLNDRNSVEQDLEGSSSPLVFGALVDIRRAVWVPVESRGRLRGVMRAGLRTRHGVLPTSLLEAVSAELALAMELDGERRKARERQADLAEVAASGPTDAMLTEHRARAAAASVARGNGHRSVWRSAAARIKQSADGNPGQRGVAARRGPPNK